MQLSATAHVPRRSEATYAYDAKIATQTRRPIKSKPGEFKKRARAILWSAAICRRFLTPTNSKKRGAFSHLFVRKRKRQQVAALQIRDIVSRSSRRTAVAVSVRKRPRERCPPL